MKRDFKVLVMGFESKKIITWPRVNGTGKVRPRTGYEGSQGEWKYSVFSFFNLCARLCLLFRAALRSLYPRKREPVAIV